MRPLFLAALLFAGGSVSAQKTIQVEEAANHVGDSVQVCGHPLSVRYAVQENGKPTYFYFGKAYPNHQLTMVIWQKDRKSFKEEHVELAYGDTDICIQGRIELVDGKPVIVVRSESQIGVKDDE